MIEKSFEGYTGKVKVEVWEGRIAIKCNNKVWEYKKHKRKSIQNRLLRLLKTEEARKAMSFLMPFLGFEEYLKTKAKT